MAVGLTIKIAGTVVELFLPYILTHILDNVIGTLQIEKVVFWGIIMIICAGLACAGNIIANRMAANTSAQPMYSISVWLSLRMITPKITAKPGQPPSQMYFSLPLLRLCR